MSKIQMRWWPAAPTGELTALPDLLATFWETGGLKQNGRGEGREEREGSNWGKGDEGLVLAHFSFPFSAYLLHSIV